jgi:hypothetical protein
MSPPNNLQLAQREGRVALAVQAFKQGQFSSLRAAANMFDIPEPTLRRRVKGIIARRDSTPINQKLTTIEESTLIK